MRFEGSRSGDEVSSGYACSCLRRLVPKPLLCTESKGLARKEIFIMVHTLITLPGDEAKIIFVCRIILACTLKHGSKQHTNHGNQTVWAPEEI